MITSFYRFEAKMIGRKSYIVVYRKNDAYGTILYDQPVVYTRDRLDKNHLSIIDGLDEYIFCGVLNNAEMKIMANEITGKIKRCTAYSAPKKGRRSVFDWAGDALDSLWAGKLTAM